MCPGGEKKHTKARSSDSHQNMTVIPRQRPDCDEGSRRLIDFSAASKWWFSVQAQLSFMEGLLSPDTCSGIHANGLPANILYHPCETRMNYCGV